MGYLLALVPNFEFVIRKLSLGYKSARLVLCLIPTISNILVRSCSMVIHPLHPNFLERSYEK